MSDSRRFSKSLISGTAEISQFLFKKHIGLFILSITSSLALIAITESFIGFTLNQSVVLFIFYLAIFLWVTEAIAPFAVSILIVGLLVFLLGYKGINPNPHDVQLFVNTWSNNVIWLILGGFFLALGMAKVEIDILLFSKSLKVFGTNPIILLLALMIVTGILSSVTSNTATTAMVLSTIAPLITQLKRDKLPYYKAFLLGIPASASIGGISTVIGTPPNAIVIGAVQNVGLNISFLKWMIYGSPVALILIFITWFALKKKFMNGISIKEKINFDFHDVEQKKISLVDKIIVWTTLVITIGLWLTMEYNKIPASAIAGIPIVFFTLTNIITAQDIRKISWETLILIAGALSLGLAIEQTGLSAKIIELIGEISINKYLLLIIFSIVTVIFANFISHTATTAIIMPLILSLKLEPILFSVSIGLSASMAMFFPISTPPNAIAFSTGLIEQKDFRYLGTIIGIAGPVLIILWISLLTL